MSSQKIFALAKEVGKLAGQSVSKKRNEFSKFGFGDKLQAVYIGGFMPSMIGIQYAVAKNDTSEFRVVNAVVSGIIGGVTWPVTVPGLLMVNFVTPQDKLKK